MYLIFLPVALMEDFSLDKLIQKQDKANENIIFHRLCDKRKGDVYASIGTSQTGMIF